MKKTLRRVLKVILVLFILLNIVVIFHAYKFTHFYNYGEVTVKPANQKTGWDKTKEILFGFNTAKRPDSVPAGNFSTIYFSTKDNLKLQAWDFKVDSAKGTVVMFHGHGSNKAAILTEAEGFRHLGYNTLLVDFRAHGNSEGNTTTIGYKEAEDIKLAYDHVKISGEKNIILWGISMGAASITKAMHDYKLEPSRVILEMPFGSLPDAVRGRIKMMHLPAEPLSTLLTFWGGTIRGFWAYNLKPEEYVKDIKCPVLLQWGKNDPRVTEKETNAVYANIKTAKKLVVYENSGHESLCKKEHEKWMAEITAFLP
ncbi:alpha/beta hydrolase [Ferruginibacter sp. HRS2-29]|uniref:alpha/beta hydrolase n=1 Tax=Ferruginibacter sp. HRS2-29 TaxID=2487334 RepID=UPI0020CFBA2A|nr:alpha/beta fold hydrolase [Ferruginibacter sp. HRS2-29]MCP9752669.1 alpha/beta fold hydrolase [Ferruginibacter sp. HRS2-29]